VNAFVNTPCPTFCADPEPNTFEVNGFSFLEAKMSQAILDAPAVFQAPPTKYAAALRAFARPAAPLRVVVAAVSALGVGAPVAALFVPLAVAESSNRLVAALCVIAALAAPSFTFLTVLVAQSTKTTRGAVGMTLLGCVSPPTMMFALTFYGLVFAVPAGLVAFALVVPIVLAAREIAAHDSADAIDRMLAPVSAWLVPIGAVALLVERLYGGQGAWGALPLLASLLVVLIRDGARLIVLMRARHGVASGLALRPATPDDAALPRLSAGLLARGPFEVLERVTTLGDGAFRSTRTTEPLGLVRAPWARFALAAIVALMAAGALLLSFPR